MIGACGSGVSMPAEVVAVRQSLVPLVAGGYPPAAAVATATASWPAWAQDSFIMSARTVAAS